MKSFQYSITLFISSVITTLLLSSCGGGGSSSTGVVNNSNHPKFLRNKVTESPRYAPSGEINQTMPTFSWSAIENATYYRLGHESTDYEIDDWHEYTLTPNKAGCHNKGDTCLFTPNDYTFPLDFEKVWWVQAEINGQWQEWSRPIVFTVVDSGNSYSGDIPQPITPVGTIATEIPEFTWSEVDGAVIYKLGFENIVNYNSWKVFDVPASNCQTGICSFTPPYTGFYHGENVAWWVKAEDSKGLRSDWSEAAKINISLQQAQKPFIFNVTFEPNSIGAVDFVIDRQERGDYNIDCDSDGILEAQHVTFDYTCHYANSGTYKITISGVFKGLHLASRNSTLSKFEVLQWGDSKWSSMNRAFADSYHSGLEVIFSAQDTPNLSKPNISMTSAFTSLHNFNSDISNWDVSHVWHMDFMFNGASSFNSDISNWDVSNVKLMDYMFNGASSFDQDIGNWDVRHVVSMRRMFEGASSFNSDISNWDVSNVTDMTGMFKNASSFNQDISNWDVSHVTRMRDMFSGASAFSQDINLYDNLLIRWSQLDLRHGVEFSAGDAKYSSAAADARDTLINDFGWIITDGGRR